ncbi:MAG TPA: hypothetical protein PLZ86_07725, partial [bacterium]|nr:hypothetical protein [bacterium]
LIPVPDEIDLSGEAGAGPLGLRMLSISENGLSVGTGPDTNSVTAALKAALVQLLHVNGEPVEYRIPQ